MIVILCGSNSFLIELEYKKLVDEFLSANGDLAIEKLSGESITYDYLVSSVQAVPFLSDRKMVIIDGLSLNKELVEKFERLEAVVADSTDLVIKEVSIDKRTAFYKLLKKQGGFNEFGDLDDFALSKWSEQYAKTNGLELTSSDMRYLVERIGNNQMLIASEIEKLSLFSKKPNREEINKLVAPSPQSKIFDLVESAFGGDIEKTMSIYDDQRKQKVEPQAILAMVMWQMNILALVVTAGNKSAAQIAADSKQSPYVIQKTMTIAKKTSINRVKELVGRILELDKNMKTVSIDADEAVRTLLLRLASN